MDCIRIVPAGDAMVGGTKVLTPDWKEIPGVTCIKVTFEPGSYVTAELELMADMDPVDAVPLFGPDTLRRSAEAQGFLLVPREADASSEPLRLAAAPARWKPWQAGLMVSLGFLGAYVVFSLAGTALTILTLGEVLTTLLGG